MSELTLRRYGSVPDVATYGALVFGDTEMPTVEQPWNDNIPYKSCIPCGVYRLVPHISNKFKMGGQPLNTFALVNEDLGVYHWETDILQGDEGRFVVLIHPANVASQLEGCIAPGNKFAVLDLSNHPAQLGVTSSQASFKQLYKFIVHNDITTINVEPVSFTWEV